MRREERRNYNNNEFEDWRHDFHGVQPWTQRLRPKSANRRTAEKEDDSSEERATNSPSLGKYSAHCACIPIKICIALIDDKIN